MRASEKISIIIPVYNMEKYLDRCIRSVVNQTYRNLEIILVDDGSEDFSAGICDQWSKKDNRIRVIHKSNGGLSDARNAGLDIASGSYIGFVDSDDFIHPKMYQRLYEDSKRMDADISVCGFDLISEKYEKLSEVKLLGDCLLSKKEALTYMCKYVTFAVVCNKLYKSDIFRDLRFEKGKIAEDVFIMPRIYHRCKRLYFSSFCGYCYVQTPDSITRRPKTIQHLDTVEAYHEMLLFCRNSGYGDLLPDIALKVTQKYLQIRFEINEIRPSERTRIHEIKKMVRYDYHNYGQKIRPFHKLCVECPVLFACSRPVRKLLND